VAEAVGGAILRRPLVAATEARWGGVGEDAGAQESERGSYMSSWVDFIERGEERGLRPEVMAINGHGGRRPSMH
jgi:hypothetical protein